MSLSEAAEVPVEGIRTLVRRANEGSVHAEWWEGIRTLAVSRMQDAGHPQGERLEWARIAVTAVHAREKSSTRGKEVPLSEEARVRAYVISGFGPVEGDPLRDPLLLCEKVLGGIDENRESLAAAAAKWRESSRARMLELRRVKNMLLPLRDVEPFLDEAYVESKLRPWLELVDFLP